MRSQKNDSHRRDATAWRVCTRARTERNRPRYRLGCTFRVHEYDNGLMGGLSRCLIIGRDTLGDTGTTVCAAPRRRSNTGPPPLLGRRRRGVLVATPARCCVRPTDSPSRATRTSSSSRACVCVRARKHARAPVSAVLTRLPFTATGRVRAVLLEPVELRARDIFFIGRRRIAGFVATLYLYIIRN